MIIALRKFDFSTFSHSTFAGWSDISLLIVVTNMFYVICFIRATAAIAGKFPLKQEWIIF